jgi:hypothetical protein
MLGSRKYNYTFSNDSITILLNSIYIFFKSINTISLRYGPTVTGKDEP